MSLMIKNPPTQTKACPTNGDTSQAKKEQFWWHPLDSLSPSEWEALCDGCGVCCLIKFLDDDDPKHTEYTDVACQLLDCQTGHCSNYANRQHFVPDCIALTADKLPKMMWLPRHCAYKRLYLGQGLPAWHYLIAGQVRHNKAMDKVGVRGRCVSETTILEEAIEERVVKWVKV